MKNILNAKVHLIAGKGGVGKSQISHMLASYFAQEKFKTLIINLSEQESIKEPKKSLIYQIDENLFGLTIFFESTLKEYIALKIGKLNHGLKEYLLSHRLFQAMILAFPGLLDLVSLGKIWFHADPINTNRSEIFDKIVVDCKSSGFLGRFLGIADLVYRAVKIGPIAHEANLIRNYFKQKENVRLHLVSICEELVVNETILLYKEIKKQNDIFGILFLNMLSPINFNKFSNDFLFNENKKDELYKIFRQEKEKYHTEEIEKTKLIKNIPIPTIEIPYSFSLPSLKEVIEKQSVNI